MKRIFLILFFLLLFPFQVIAESPFVDLKSSNLFLSPIKLKVLTNKTIVSHGQEFKFHLSILIKKGWHIYALKPFHGNESLTTQILMDKNNFQEQGDWKGPDPILIKDGALGKLVKGHKGRIEFSKTYLVPISVVPKVYSLTGNLVFRACNNQVCTLPRKFPFNTEIEVSAN